MRWALGVEYDGRGFDGWQTQPHGNTVQDVLERALARIAGESARSVCAGRTDAGVHAIEQVVHFDARVVRPSTAWVRGVNARLPDAVAVRWAREVPDAFHARYSAVAREYRYLLLNDLIRPALASGRVGWFHRHLDEGVMQAAATRLCGEHDFSAFRAAQCQARSPVRHLSQARVIRRGRWIVFDFRANAFLHHMVRNMVGALVYVGVGRHPVEWVTELLEQRDRRLAAPTFAPDGLYLARVEYDDSWQLPVKVTDDPLLSG